MEDLKLDYWLYFQTRMMLKLVRRARGHFVIITVISGDIWVSRRSERSVEYNYRGLVLTSSSNGIYFAVLSRRALSKVTRPHPCSVPSRQHRQQQCRRRACVSKYSWTPLFRSHKGNIVCCGSKNSIVFTVRQIWFELLWCLCVSHWWRSLLEVAGHVSTYLTAGFWEAGHSKLTTHASTTFFNPRHFISCIICEFSLFQWFWH